MNVIKTTKPRTSTLLTAYDLSLAISIDTQKESLLNLRPKFSKTIVIGKIDPGKYDGFVFIKSDPFVTRTLRTYLIGIPGVDTCVLTNPDITMEGDLSSILKRVEDSGFDASWCCHQDERIFVMSSPVAAHLMADMPEMTFNENWGGWVHDWMVKMLRQRYIDVSNLGVFKQINPPTTPFISLQELAQVMVNYQENEAKEVKKRGRPSTVKRVKAPPL
jgi:hypothetical protein